MRLLWLILGWRRKEVSLVVQDADGGVNCCFFGLAHLVDQRVPVLELEEGRQHDGGYGTGWWFGRHVWGDGAEINGTFKDVAGCEEAKIEIME